MKIMILDKLLRFDEFEIKPFVPRSGEGVYVPKLNMNARVENVIYDIEEGEVRVYVI